MKRAAYISSELFQFLRELKRHNQRDWFLKNKARYETNVRNPFLRLIAELRPLLNKVSPHFVVDPSPTGGSMMRLYRDIRFSKDKSPYKTSVSAHFWHAHGEEGMTPAFYCIWSQADLPSAAGCGALPRKDSAESERRSWRRQAHGRKWYRGAPSKWAAGWPANR
jgi:uncharacterized protein (TIGR02453 family)